MPGAGEVGVAPAYRDLLEVAVMAHAEIHPDLARARQAAAGVAGVVHRLVGQLQHQPLLRVGDARFIVRHAEEVGGKQVGIVQRRHVEGAALAAPAICGHRLREAAALAQVVPKGGERGGAGEASRDADHGDVVAPGGRHGGRRCDGGRWRRCGAVRLGHIVGDLAYALALQQQRIAEVAAEVALEPRQHVDRLDRSAAQCGEGAVDRQQGRFQLQHVGPDRPHRMLRRVKGRFPVKGLRGAGLRCVGVKLCDQGVEAAVAHLLGQLVALDLAAGGARNFARRQHRIDRERQIGPGRITHRMQGLPVNAPGAPAHKQHHPLAPAGGVGQAAGRHGAVSERMAFAHMLLEVGRHHAAAIDENDVLLAPGDGQATVDQAAQVARAQPAIVREQAHVGAGVALVAVGDVDAAQLDFAQLARARDAAIRADDTDLHRGQGRAAVDVFERVGAVQGRLGHAARGQRFAIEPVHGGAGHGDADRQAGFSHAVGWAHGPGRQPEARHLGAETTHHLRRDRFGAIVEQAQTRQVQAVGGSAGQLVEHVLEPEIGAAADAGAVQAHLAQPGQRVGDEMGRRHPDLGHAHIQRYQVKTDQAHVMEIGHPGDRAFLATHGRGFGNLAHIAQQVAVA